MACDLVHIPIECTQADEVAEGLTIKGCLLNRGLFPGPGVFPFHQVGIRDLLELAPLTIELALGASRTIACGVDACTPRQLAIVVGLNLAICATTTDILKSANQNVGANIMWVHLLRLSSKGAPVVETTL